MVGVGVGDIVGVAVTVGVGVEVSRYTQLGAWPSTTYQLSTHPSSSEATTMRGSAMYQSVSLGTKITCFPCDLSCTSEAKAPWIVDTHDGTTRTWVTIW